jgi:hypothetical protein
MKKIIVDGVEVFMDDPLSEWFELSYAQFLTIPRLVLESMSYEWQEKMKALLEEMDATFDWRPEEGRYWVKLKDDKGRYCDAPLNDYRHGSCEHLRIKPEETIELNKVTHRIEPLDPWPSPPPAQNPGSK